MAGIGAGTLPDARAGRLPRGHLWRENLDEPLYEEKQMTTNDAQASGVGASSADAQMWDQVSWDHIEAEVKRLQMRIAKAVREAGGARRKSCSVC